MIEQGIPCLRTTSQKNNWALWDASKVLLQGVKWIILKNRSTTTNTNTKSNPQCVRESLRIKFIIKSFHIFSGIGNGVYKILFFCLSFGPFADGTCLNKFSHISAWAKAKKNLSFNRLMVLLCLTCPPSPPICNSWIKSSRSYDRGIHSWTPLNKNLSCIR